MGQKLYLIQHDNYRLNITAFDDENFNDIANSESKYSYQFAFREKLNADPIAVVKLDNKEGKIGFSFKTSLPFGTYLYTIDLIDMLGEIVEIKGEKQHLTFGFVEVLPNV